MLWNGRLPNQAELDEHTARIRRNYEAPTEVIDLMKQYPKDSDPMDVLRTAVSSLDLYDPKGQGTDRESAVGAAVRITGQIGTIVAAWENIRNGKEPVASGSQAKHRREFPVYASRRKGRTLMRRGCST